MEHEKHRVFSLDLNFKGPIKNKLFSIVKGPLEKAFSLTKCQEIHDAAREGANVDEFLEKTFNKMNVKYLVSSEDLERIPKKGPVLAVSNHPFGAIEGMILAAILRSVRPDVRIMANYILGRITELRDIFVLVDPYRGKNSTAANIGAMKEAYKVLKEGGMLGVFPSGSVSSINFKKRGIIDPPWNPQIARIIRKAKVDVLPIYFRGINSIWFQLFGLIHPRIKTVMLPHELVNKQNKEIKVKISSLLNFKSLEKFSSDEDMINYLRHRSYMMKSSLQKKLDEKKTGKKKKPKAKAVCVLPGKSREFIKDEVMKLPRENTLFELGEFSVIQVMMEQSPEIVNEIGRLREITFRAIGEGTGRAIDIDIFDNYYVHLFMWNYETGEIIGAYRLGLTDGILTNYGLPGLYTSTLFKFKMGLFEYINPAIELGRSFIIEEYQRSYSPLMLLWKGIGQFVIRNPKYKILFGPVSINDDYTSFSQEIIKRFLENKHYNSHLSKYVKPRMPFKKPFLKRGFDTKALSGVIQDIDQVSALVSEVEKDHKGIPILLKQYLKLNGQLLGFNVDPDFARVLDGLILVDLTKTEPKFLERYLGKENSQFFLNTHKEGFQPLNLKK